MSLPTLSMPALMKVPPEYVLVPERVRVPAPVLVREPVPEMTALILSVPPTLAVVNSIAPLP